MAVLLRDEAFDPWAVLSAYQAAHPEWAGRVGATAVFVGNMRDFNEGDAVQRMFLEHYPGMTENHLEKISQEAAQRWPLLFPRSWPLYISFLCFSVKLPAQLSAGVFITLNFQ